MSAIMTSRQAAELDHAFERNGYTPADVKKLSEGNVLAKLLPVLQGRAEVVLHKHIINLDADPFIPNGWSVEEHRRDGQFEWSQDKVRLHLSPNQESGKVIEGNKLRRELADEPVLNANVLDYLLANPHLIPEEWKDKLVFFWGTIYRYPGGYLLVRCLCWDGVGWRRGCGWLDDGWGGVHPALVLAS